MTEKHFILDDIDATVFYGVNNANIITLKTQYPRARFVAHGEVVKVMGDEELLAEIDENIEKMRRHVQTFNTLSEDDVLRIIKGERPRKESEAKGALLFSVQGRPIIPRKGNQQRLVALWEENDMIFATGPAGSGKTYISIALAVKALKAKQVRKIILCRPAVEAGEKLGFLPGDMKEKIDPYLQPLYDALEDMIPAPRLKDMMESNIIQIAPLAFMRGRTLSDAVVILDEAQNTTPQQIKMFLTRMGQGTKMIITGDMSQIDLPAHTRSGLVDALDKLKNVEGIGFVFTDKSAIVRHKLVTRIVEAYN